MGIMARRKPRETTDEKLVRLAKLVRIVRGRGVTRDDILEEVEGAIADADKDAAADESRA